MTAPSDEELSALIDVASKLLTRHRVRPATLEELTALHQNLNVAGDNLAKVEYRSHDSHRVRWYKRAVLIRIQSAQKMQKAAVC